MWLPGTSRRRRQDLVLRDGSRIGVIGGGPAGSFFSIFLLEMADRVGLDLTVEIHEPRDFSLPGSAGCNMCGGIISESLVQALATEGINLPSTVVERGIDSYVMHMEEGSVLIRTPLTEKRIAAVHRGSGPRGVREWKWRSFDGYLLELALCRGAVLVPDRVQEVSWPDGRPTLCGRHGQPRAYDLLAVAAGVNSGLPQTLATLRFGYRAPRTTKTFICEIPLGARSVRERFGNAMHVFLLDLPRLEFAAMIPKGEHVTLCLMGRGIDASLIEAFLRKPEVSSCLPPDWHPTPEMCRCAPLMNVRGGRRPYADRIVFIGDCGVARLYKDGIGSAYRTAKAAAVTAVFDGIAARDFKRRFGRACRSISADNAIGRIVFAIAGQQRKRRHDCRGILRMVAAEQRLPGSRRRMSTVLWDIFTGSASYREVFLRTLHPRFWARLIWEILKGAAIGPRAVKRSA
jgi:flavin-dependent dehydrogenase